MLSDTEIEPLRCRDQDVRDLSAAFTNADVGKEVSIEGDAVKVGGKLRYIGVFMYKTQSTQHNYKACTKNHDCSGKIKSVQQKIVEECGEKVWRSVQKGKVQLEDKPVFSNAKHKDKVCLVKGGNVEVHGVERVVNWTGNFTNGSKTIMSVEVNWIGNFTNGLKTIMSVNDTIGGNVSLSDGTAFENPGVTPEFQNHASAVKDFIEYCKETGHTGTPTHATTTSPTTTPSTVLSTVMPTIAPLTDGMLASSAHTS